MFSFSLFLFVHTLYERRLQKSAFWFERRVNKSQLDLRTYAALLCRSTRVLKGVAYQLIGRVFMAATQKSMNTFSYQYFCAWSKRILAIAFVAADKSTDGGTMGLHNEGPAQSNPITLSFSKNLFVFKALKSLLTAASAPHYCRLCFRCLGSLWCPRILHLIYMIVKKESLKTALIPIAINMNDIR